MGALVAAVGMVDLDGSYEKPNLRLNLVAVYEWTPTSRHYVAKFIGFPWIISVAETLSVDAGKSRRESQTRPSTGESGSAENRWF